LLGRCLTEAFARGGVEMAMGTRLYEVFVAAGVEEIGTTTALVDGTATYQTSPPSSYSRVPTDGRAPTGVLTRNRAGGERLH
jgi:hypothetical protein